MKIKVWGARGSLPSPILPEAAEKRTQDLLDGFFEAGFKKHEEVQKYLKSLPRHRVAGYGGNSPCIEVIAKDEKQRFIIDCGSGIRPLGEGRSSGPLGKGQGEEHIFLTHFHWDHLIGLPFYPPIYVPGNKIHFYAVQEELPSIIKQLFTKPFFPVPFEVLGADIEFHALEPRKPIQIGDFKITPYKLDHPDPCWGYKVQCDGKTYSHCVDTECTRVSRKQLGEDLPLYQDVDLMMFDAQYTLMETIERMNWGHAAASLGLDIAMRENIKRMLFMHHDPASSDDRIAAAEKQAQRYYEAQVKTMKRADTGLHEVEWEFAYEGMVVEVK